MDQRRTVADCPDICYENGTLVISDEIHADLTLPPYKHPTFALISEKAPDELPCLYVSEQSV